MEPVNNERDFTSISPSARWLLILKGHTTIPFAREAAELTEHPKTYVPDFKKRDFTFWAATYHLESRYRSIDKLLDELPQTNILELSSGYSFRGLDLARKKNVYYIDTDLPDIAANKRKLSERLIENAGVLPGKLEILPLNVLEEESFREIVSHFPPGEIVIVNEGLLTYFEKPEKEKLCRTIRNILKELGGYWITADIYLKNKMPGLGLQDREEVKKFKEQMNTESKSFESFEEAEMFFKEMGFVVEKEAVVKSSEIGSLKYLLKSVSFRQMLKLRKKGKLQATWRLKAV
jgi:O-methyltransferase involved in polyketide biosynthesis